MKQLGKWERVFSFLDRKNKDASGVASSDDDIARLTRLTALFNEDWYLENNPDVLRASMCPLQHYLDFGWREGRNPHPLFDTEWYLEKNPDVVESGGNPFSHFVEHGAFEGRSPHPVFDCAWYRRNYGDVEDGVNPLLHFLSHRGDSVRNPSAAFDLVAQVRKFPNSRSDKVHELAYFVSQGQVFDSPNVPVREIFGGMTRVADGDWEWARYQPMKAKLAAGERDRASGLNATLPKMPISKDALVSISEIVIPQCDNPQVSIIIPVYNKRAVTLRCLKTLVQSIGHVSYEVIIADDGSTEPASLELAEVPGIRFLGEAQNLGFGGNCNRAASSARGSLILFLNNDTQLLPGFLDAMVAALVPGVGVVGPQVLYPSGRLQEAGARLRVDGAGVLIGHGAHPNDPRYAYSRDVEYVSGACLLIEKVLFEELGGFDPVFQPAYYEDVDLCFRVRRHGLRVVYEARARIFHSMSETMAMLSDTYKWHQSVRCAQKFSERWQAELEDRAAVKAIAFYLPQYHTIPENDLWWGPGFTEWTNVCKAKPNYEGHDQPKMPADLGHYDLTRADSIRKQIELGRRYGLHGFCFYYYWFNGRRILEAPTELYLSDKSLDFPFCLCWANENWSRRWDGREDDLLLKQEYLPKDDRAIIRDLMRFMSDPRYIRIEGRPLVIIYRWDLLPSVAETVSTWRDECRRAGLGEIFVASVDSFDLAWKLKDAAEVGLDASIGFPPHNMGSPVAKSPTAVAPDFTGTIDDYETVGVRYAVDFPVRPFTHFPGVLPGWDNTPRRQQKAFILDEASPGAFRAWLEHALEFSRDFNPPERRMVFINAWNEWAEGAYLEPDQRFGHAYLTALQDALESHKFQARNK